MEEATASIPVAAASMAELTVDLGPHRVVVQDIILVYIIS